MDSDNDGLADLDPNELDRDGDGYLDAGNLDDIHDWWDNLGNTVGAATEQVERASSSQTELASEMLNAVRALKAAFSDSGLSRISGIVEDAEVKFSEINDELRKNEVRLTGTLDGINTQAEVLNATSSSLATYERKIESSAKSIDEINNEYIEGLSKAAETLRTKTDQI